MRNEVDRFIPNCIAPWYRCFSSILDRCLETQLSYIRFIGVIACIDGKYITIIKANNSDNSNMHVMVRMRGRF
jgi:hypothetical protein